MFGFGKRKKYNGSVDIKINNEYQITTKNNPLFPGVMAYLELIDNAWNAKMSEDEAALYIATLYYCGIVKHGRKEEAAKLNGRIHEVVEFGIPRGLISKERWRKFSLSISNANKEAESDAGKNSLGLAEENLIAEFKIKLEYLPEPKSVEDLFYSMGSRFSHEAQTSLLYRLVVMNYLGAIKLARDEGRNFEPEDILWLTQIADKSADWSEMAEDHVELEQVANQLNMNIMRFFESFGIRQG